MLLLLQARANVLNKTSFGETPSVCVSLSLGCPLIARVAPHIIRHPSRGSIGNSEVAGDDQASGCIGICTSHNGWHVYTGVEKKGARLVAMRRQFGSSPSHLGIIRVVRPTS